VKVVVEFEYGPRSVAATSPDFPNVVAIGEDHDDALMRLRRSIEEWIEWHRDLGEPLKVPSDDRVIEIIAA